MKSPKLQLFQEFVETLRGCGRNAAEVRDVPTKSVVESSEPGASRWVRWALERPDPASVLTLVLLWSRRGETKDYSLQEARTPDFPNATSRGHPDLRRTLHLAYTTTDELIPSLLAPGE